MGSNIFLRYSSVGGGNNPGETCLYMQISIYNNNNNNNNNNGNNHNNIYS